jgi:hypothetical protein
VNDFGFQEFANYTQDARFDRTFQGGLHHGENGNNPVSPHKLQKGHKMRRYDVDE